MSYLICLSHWKFNLKQILTRGSHCIYNYKITSEFDVTCSVWRLSQYYSKLQPISQVLDTSDVNICIICLDPSFFNAALWQTQPSKQTWRVLFLVLMYVLLLFWLHMCTRTTCSTLRIPTWCTQNGQNVECAMLRTSHSRLSLSWPRNRTMEPRIYFQPHGWRNVANAVSDVISTSREISTRTSQKN